MARTEVVTYACDWGGEDITNGGGVTRRASVDGRRFRVDLCTACSDALDVVLARVAPGGVPRSEASRRRGPEVRSWAKARGFQVGDRGRIPAGVVAEYDARGAHERG